MHVISRKIIREAEALRAWLAEAEKADWTTPHEVKLYYPKASIIADNRVVFDIVGGRYRLIVHINYQAQVILVKFFDTHQEYNKIDAATYGKPTNQ